MFSCRECGCQLVLLPQTDTYRHARCGMVHAHEPVPVNLEELD